MKNKRNEYGWRIPRYGTKAYAVFLLLMEGYNNDVIRQVTGLTPVTVRTLTFKIRNPERYNFHNRSTRARKKARDEQSQVIHAQT